ncbi:MAG: HU family DNA-binding protein [Rickettsiaceae bacterium H1]|nr:HU family DNA-binding protein [Rickettsiaceae bacterium H1]
MKREDVVNAIVNSNDLSIKKSDAVKIYNSVVECMFNSLKRGETVRLANIGTLSLTTRKATTYRNPQTKQLIKKPSHKRIKFSMSKNIKDEIN